MGLMMMEELVRDLINAKCSYAQIVDAVRVRKPLGEDITEDEYTPPPVLNQHEDEILSGLLGYSQEKIVQLRKEEQSNSPEHRTHVRKEI